MEIIISAIIFLLYGCTCALCLILTFSREKYLEIETIVNSKIFLSREITPLLEVSVNWFNEWLIFYNKVTGPVLVVLSILDLKLSFLLINSFS